MSDDTRFPKARRSFLSQIGAGAGLAGAALVGAPALQAQGGAGAFQPAKHTQDDWLDLLPGSHRFVFDTTSASGFGTALLYANNFFTASESGYGLKDSAAAVVIIARHSSTPYAYNDAIWAKYGAHLAGTTGLNDPATKQAPQVNLFNTNAQALPSRGTTIDTLLKRGVHFAVCRMATQLYSRQLAQATGGTAEAVFNELTANLVGNAHLVAAGIVAVNRAQERGYTLATVA
jgi:intracellular sulfur oxidation DsrE/DsrF family protein